MAILIKDPVSKGTPAEFTLEKAELAQLGKVLADAHFGDTSAWKAVSVVYKSKTSNQNKTVVFDCTKVEAAGIFNSSEFADNLFDVQSLTIHDFDGGSLTIDRTELPTADFDLDIEGVITVPTPENLAVTVQWNLSRLFFAWDAMTGIDGIRLYRSVNGGEYQVVSTLPATAANTFSSVADLNEGDVLLYRVVSFLGDVESSPAQSESYTRPAIPGPITGFVAAFDSTKGKIVVSSDDVPNTDTVELHRTAPAPSTILQTFVGGTGIYYEDTPLSTSTHRYRMTIIKGSISIVGTQLSVVPPAKPLEVQTVTAVQQLSGAERLPQVKIQFYPNDNDTSPAPKYYEIYRVINGVETLAITTEPSTSTAQVSVFDDITGLFNLEDSFFYKVYAYQNGMQSEPASSAVGTLYGKLPAPVMSHTLDEGEFLVTLNWNQFSNTNYTVEYSVLDMGEWTSWSYLDGGLKATATHSVDPGMSYRYRVYGVYMGVNSDFSNVVEVTVPPLP